jgi:hypothetical protein
LIFSRKIKTISIPRFDRQKEDNIALSLIAKTLTILTLNPMLGITLAPILRILERYFALLDEEYVLSIVLCP